MSPPGTRAHHPVFARLYARLSHVAEEAGTREHRERLLANLYGSVIEIGCGNGLNFAHYPEAVTEVTAIEPEPYLRAQAVDMARHCNVAVRVIDASADALPIPDDHYDAAVASLVLCSVEDPLRALSEIRRVLRPGGELRFYEHVRAANDPLRRFQRLASPVWQRFAGGCRLDRDTEQLIKEAGFTVVTIDRFDFQPGPRFPVALVRPHILGSARAPTDDQ